MIRSFFQSKNQTVCAIDIGSGKLSCWIASLDAKGQEAPVLLGKGYSGTQGLFAGNLSNINALEKCLAYVIYEAEKEAGVRVKDVILSLNGAFFKSDYYKITLPLPQGKVTSADIQNLVMQASQKKDADFHAIHVIPLDFQIEGQTRIQDPRGMIGKEMIAYVHVLWMSSSQLKTLLECLKRCQINVLNVLFSGYTSALSCLVQDEKELGATLIDIGSGSTTIACFYQSKMVSSYVIPLGGQSITHDVARGCETSLQHAERLKILYGAALPLNNDHREMIPILPLGEKNEKAVIQIPRAFLVNVVQARIEEILKNIKNYLQHVSTAYPFATQRVIFTGGVSQTPGLKEKAQVFFERPTRLALPLTMQASIKTQLPEFSSMIGTFFYKGMSDLIQEPSFFTGEKKIHPEKPKKMFFWLRKNL